MGVNLHALPPKTAADRARLRKAFVAQSKTRAKTSAAARRAHGIKPPEAARMAYTAGLGRLLKAMWAIVLEGYRPDIDAATVKQDDLRGARPFAVADRARVKLYRLIEERAPGLVDETAKGVSAHNAREVKRVVGVDPRIDPGGAAHIEQFRKENVRLITSIADEQITRVEATLSENFGTRVEDMAEKLEEEFKITKSRANLIARDQTLKLNGQLTQTRQQSAGVEEYIWIGSDDERERESHLANNNQRFRWDNPPPETGHPGEDFQCRCTAYPVIPGLEDEG